MLVKKFPFVICAFLSAIAVCAPNTVKEKAARKETITQTGPALMWQEPADIESRDLFYGPGGKDHVPDTNVAFVKEDLEGTSPKFVVQDHEGHHWKVKLGLEARSETAASRIVWAVGYYASDDYFVPELHVSGMPDKLHRGNSLVEPDGVVRGVRLKREPHDMKKIGTWDWRSNAFSGTREWNGLRVLMALINNWDLKDENNAIYEENGRRIFMVSDLGASFGAPGRAWPRDTSKDNLEAYKDSAFIRRISNTSVDFEVPARPRYMYWVNPKETLSRVHLEWIGRNVPRDDARWMGQLLSRLSAQQFGDAFRASGYSPEECRAFTAEIQRRIAALAAL